MVNTINAQTAVDSVIIDDVDSVVEHQTETYKDGTSSKTEYVRADFELIDTSKITAIQVGKINLNDTIESIKKDGAYWYADGVENEKPKKAKKSNNSFGKGAVKVLASNTFTFITWVVIIGIIITLIVLFLRSNGIGLFTARKRNIAIAESENEVSENIFEIDFETVINKYIVAGNHKIATRLLFLRLLKSMSEKNIVQYAPDKTNFDYLFALIGTASFNDFANVVKHYEYVWYGDFAVNEQQFNLIKNNFDELQQKVTI
jgi:hypothetical protein